MKGGGGQIDHPPPSPGKTTLKKPSLVRVKMSSVFDTSERIEQITNDP